MIGYYSTHKPTTSISVKAEAMAYLGLIVVSAIVGYLMGAIS